MRKAGQIIDAHDEVFRFNNAPTQGYEEHVGSRTTYMVLHNRVSHATPLSPAAYWSRHRDGWRDGNRTTLPVVLDGDFAKSALFASQANGPQPWLVLSGHGCAMPQYIFRRETWMACSTGMALIHFLLRDREVFGCNVTLFGLSDTAANFHYYERPPPAASSVEGSSGAAASRSKKAATKSPFTPYHNFELEHNVLRKSAAASLLQLDGERVELQGPDPKKRVVPSWQFVMREFLHGNVSGLQPSRR